MPDEEKKGQEEVDQAIDKVLENKVVKDRVDKIVSDAKDNLEQDIMARHEFISYVDNNPTSDSLKNYKQVARDEYNSIVSKIADASKNISSYDKESIQEIRSRLDNAIAIEGRLVEKLNATSKSSMTQSDVQRDVSSAPNDLGDILRSPEKYEKYRIGRSNTYNTVDDDKTYDARLIGSWNDPVSAKYMTDVVLKDFSEIEQRNVGFKSASRII